MTAPKKTRVHEWAWGYEGIRTVCGVGSPLARKSTSAIVKDLGEIEATYRCKNCERMRSATGTSSRKGE